MAHRYLVGIDEAGRGPLAGPVAVGAVVVPINFDWALVEGARDSKKMTPKSREALYETLCSLEDNRALRFEVSLSSARVIDEAGIVQAIRTALFRSLARLSVTPDECLVLLDGGLRAPVRFLHQKTIIRGDSSEPVISLASIAAKVHRDRYMQRMALLYPNYGFERHKGYGTENHCTAITHFGLTDLHRKTFCRALT